MDSLEKAYQEIKKLQIKENEYVVAAISGGPDSMALLNLLIKYKKTNNINIVVAHVDHNVRKESKDELLFVKEYSIKNNCIFESMKIEEKIEKNFESTARKIRYEFFNKLIKQYNAKYLFTAHHADDLIETILMRISRGSNIQGYIGFKKIAKYNNYYSVKPLIWVTKQEIIDYNKKNNIPWVEDKTNKEDIHTRNRYRNYILPKLKEENPKIHLKFLKFSENIIECSEYIDREIDKIINRVYIDNKINIKEFLNLDIFIQKNLLYKILKEEYQDEIHNINEKHIKSILSLTHKKGSGSINLPNQKIIIKNYNYLEFSTKKEQQEGYRYTLGKEQELPNGAIISQENKVTDNSNYTCLINSNEITLPIIIRNKQPGDKMEVKNLKGSKKISDIFISEKIDKEKRDMYPVVTDSKNNIIWLPGIKKSKYCKQKEEKYDIILRYH